MARTYKRDSRGRFASGGGGSSGGRSSGKRSTPKTTTARGRALQNQRRASDLVRAGRGGSGPSKKAVRSAVTAMRARAYYAATGTGTKRSAKKAVSATKKRKQVRAEIGAKRKAATVRVNVTKKHEKKSSSTLRINLNKNELTDRISGEFSRTIKNRLVSPSEKDLSAKAKKTRRVIAAREDFYQHIYTKAVITARERGVQGRLTPEQSDRYFVEAFRTRPRYSTRQRVRPRWDAARSRALRPYVTG